MVSSFFLLLLSFSLSLKYGKLKNTLEVALLTTSKEWDMREEISVSLDLMIIIPMTVNDPI